MPPKWAIAELPPLCLQLKISMVESGFEICLTGKHIRLKLRHLKREAHFENAPPSIIGAVRIYEDKKSATFWKRPAVHPSRYWKRQSAGSRAAKILQAKRPAPPRPTTLVVRRGGAR
eukprot:9476389-Pyramimonas_sp.AAC.2